MRGLVIRSKVSVLPLTLFEPCYLSAALFGGSVNIYGDDRTSPFRFIHACQAWHLDPPVRLHPKSLFETGSSPVVEFNFGKGETKTVYLIDYLTIPKKALVFRWQAEVGGNSGPMLLVRDATGVIYDGQRARDGVYLERALRSPNCEFQRKLRAEFGEAEILLFPLVKEDLRPKKSAKWRLPRLRPKRRSTPPRLSFGSTASGIEVYFPKVNLSPPKVAGLRLTLRILKCDRKRGRKLFDQLRHDDFEVNYLGLRSAFPEAADDIRPIRDADVVLVGLAGEDGIKFRPVTLTAEAPSERNPVLSLLIIATHDEKVQVGLVKNGQEVNIKYSRLLANSHSLHELIHRAQVQLGYPSAPKPSFD